MGVRTVVTNLGLWGVRTVVTNLGLWGGGGEDHCCSINLVLEVALVWYTYLLPQIAITPKNL